ncbi:AlpA family phage regulatory protein [Photobacterium halotolerans]
MVTMALTGLSRSSIYNYINDKRFPGQVSLGCRSVAWGERNSRLV